MFCSKVKGVGHYLPKKCVTNQDLETMMETTHDWIFSRTGIEQRYIASAEETTAFMAAQAAKEALDQAHIHPNDVDMIVLATTTPDHPFPAAAVKVQSLLGAKNAFAFDVQAVCSGFIYALSVADNFIKSGQAKKVLVIGADAMSRLLNWKDRTTAVLFGDGAGAYVLEAAPYSKDSGMLSTHLFSDGDYYDLLYVNTQEPFDNKRGYIKMEGSSIYKHAIKKIGGAIVTALEKNNLTVDDVDWLVPHQANRRILESIAEHFKLPLEKMIITIGKHSNTSSATIPLATYAGIKDGKIKPNQLLVLEALGGGLTWGSAVLRLN
ncbi:MAG: 3-oxoacyl-[acyl-carrier-protein] synthase 3 [Holosporales bacterium]